MKIALVSEHASPLATLGGVDAGGQNVHVHELACGLAHLGDDVTVFTRRDGPMLPARVTTHGYVVEHVPAGPATEVPKDELWEHMPAFARYLAARWTEDRFDVAHAHFWMSGAASLWASRRTGIPVAQTFHALGHVKRRHQGDRDTSPPARLNVEATLCKSVDHVIATCADEVRELRSLGMPAGRATIVPCGVDTSVFIERPVRSERPLRIVSVGRLVERKGLADIVAAMPALCGVELTVVGGPSADSLELDPEVERLQRLARQNGTLDRIRFLGGLGREQIPAAITDADVLVAVPWYEPFGMVAIEAMACGRPVVGSSVGGLLDTVVPGVTGELVPPREPRRLADTLRSLLADEPRRARYGAAGAARARERYAWSRVAADTQAVLQKVSMRRSSSAEMAP
jgi:glycosyltransferase involved in cell wall biosynthesis